MTERIFWFDWDAQCWARTTITSWGTSITVYLEPEDLIE